MSSEVDPSMWKWLADHLWAPLSAAVGGVWYMLNSRIEGIEKKADTAVQRSEFLEYMERDQQTHEQLRQSQIKIFDKIDELKELLMTDRRRRK